MPSIMTSDDSGATIGSTRALTLLPTRPDRRPSPREAQHPAAEANVGSPPLRPTDSPSVALDGQVASVGSYMRPGEWSPFQRLSLDRLVVSCVLLRIRGIRGRLFALRLSSVGDSYKVL